MPEDNSSPATKQDLREIANLLETTKAAAKQDLREIANLLQAIRAELKADIERTETKLLTEFHKWASPAEARARTHTAALRAIDLEMEALTERVTKLEQ